MTGCRRDPLERSAPRHPSDSSTATPSYRNSYVRRCESARRQCRMVSWTSTQIVAATLIASDDSPLSICSHDRHGIRRLARVRTRRRCDGPPIQCSAAQDPDPHDSVEPRTSKAPSSSSDGRVKKSCRASVNKLQSSRATRLMGGSPTIGMRLGYRGIRQSCAIGRWTRSPVTESARVAQPTASEPKRPPGLRPADLRRRALQMPVLRSPRPARWERARPRGS
jgi:hypothetical protein